MSHLLQTGPANTMMVVNIGWKPPLSLTASNSPGKNRACLAGPRGLVHVVAYITTIGTPLFSMKTTAGTVASRHGVWQALMLPRLIKTHFRSN